MRTVIVKNKILLAAAAALLAAGCVKDDIYNTDHPDSAKVTVETEWSDRGDDVAKPVSYTVETTGFTETATADTYMLSRNFTEGNYIYYLYNTAAGITVGDGVAKVDAAADLSRQEGLIEAMPGWLFTSSVVADLEKDADYLLPVSMRQQVRQLTLVITPEGGTADRITGIDAILSGIAGTWDMASNSPSGSSAGVRPVFEKRSDGTWAATVRLLGITGRQQLLSGVIYIEASSAVEVPFESDLSAALVEFNNNKKSPLALDGTVEVVTETGFTATIKNWEPSTPGSGTAN